MEERSMEQIEQFDLLECYFKMRDQHFLSEFFKRENIYDDDLLADEECYTFFQEVHAPNLDYMFVNFTCIYVPPIDQNAYGIEDVMDILEDKQKEETFIFEVSIPKCKVTERKNQVNRSICKPFRGKYLYECCRLSQGKKGVK